MTREISYRDAITEALAEEMRRDPRVVILGEDVTAPMWPTAPLAVEFGEERVRNTPLSEAAFTGAGVGAAMTGLRPVVDLQFASLLYCAVEQIADQAAKNRYMFGGQATIPMVITCSLSHGGSVAAHHSDRTYPMFMNIPGLKIVCPTTPRDVKGLLKSAIREDDPVIVFEDNNVLMSKGEVGGEDDLVAIGSADVTIEGTDVTVVGVASAVACAVEAATELASGGISAEVIDVRTLVPLDTPTILASVRKTGHLVVVDPAARTCSAASEIAAIAAEHAFGDLRGPVVRVTSPDVVVPFSPALEQLLYPTAEKVVDGVRASLAARTPVG